MIQRFFSKLLDKIIESNKKRAEYYLLTKLSDRELSDMGLSRCDIRRIIYDS